VGALWAPKSEGVQLIVRAISFRDFQPMWSWSTNVTDRRTDGQTTCDRNTALCTIVHRAVTKPKYRRYSVLCLLTTIYMHNMICSLRYFTPH